MSIEKINQGDQLTQSMDLVQENILRLKELFPEIVTEGKIDFKVLQEVLGNELEEGDEYYRFTWAGKAQARREAHKPSTGTLRPCKVESIDWDTTENIYIEGDNLEVLKLMQKSYANKVKMIYIDPPYNTGNDFVYKDNYSDNLKNYQEITGQIDSNGNKVTTNSNSDGRYHSNWLNMIYPRLSLARNLLKNDGAIFISIDDVEINNLVKVCSEIFGEENFVSKLLWKSRQTTDSRKHTNVSIDHEYILVYAKKIDEFCLNGKDIDKSKYKNPDNDPRGPWASIDLSVQANKNQRPNQFYDIIDPSNGFIYPANPKRVWSKSKDVIDNMIKEDRIIFPNNLEGRPREKKFIGDLKSDKTGFSSWLNSNEVGYTTNGTKEFSAFFEERVFDFPKPTSLINTLISQGTKENDIVLDFFAGSSSSAHAVYKCNVMDKKLRFIQIQIPQLTSQKSEAFNVGFKTIAEIGKERLRLVSKKLKEENPLLAENFDLGFKVFKLDSSNIKGWDGNPEDLENSLFDSQDNIKTDRTEEDVLFEILLKYGLDLTLPIEEKLIEGKKVFNIGVGALFICLADGITSKIAEGIGSWKHELQPETCRVIFKDSGFTDVEKTNSVQILKRFGIAEVKSI